jgi:hypothetical protein
MSVPYRTVALQALAGLGVVLAALAWDAREAVAALAATIVSVVPNAYFAWRVDALVKLPGTWSSADIGDESNAACRAEP